MGKELSDINWLHFYMIQDDVSAYEAEVTAIKNKEDVLSLYEKTERLQSEFTELVIKTEKFKARVGELFARTRVIMDRCLERFGEPVAATREDVAKQGLPFVFDDGKKAHLTSQNRFKAIGEDAPSVSAYCRFRYGETVLVKDEKLRQLVLDLLADDLALQKEVK